LLLVALRRVTRFVGHINDSTRPDHSFLWTVRDQPPLFPATLNTSNCTRRKVDVPLHRGIDSAIVLCRRGAQAIFRQRIIDHSMSVPYVIVARNSARKNLRESSVRWRSEVSNRYFYFPYKLNSLFNIENIF